MWEFIVEIQFEGFILEIQYRELASLELNKSDLMIYSFLKILIDILFALLIKVLVLFIKFIFFQTKETSFLTERIFKFQINSIAYHLFVLYDSLLIT